MRDVVCFSHLLMEQLQHAGELNRVRISIGVLHVLDDIENAERQKARSTVVAGVR